MIPDSGAQFSSVPADTGLIKARMQGGILQFGNVLHLSGRAIGLHIWHAPVALLSLPITTHRPAHSFKISSSIAPPHS